MRPVDKGEAPKVKFRMYQDAEPYLEKQIGAYCSFCEFNIQHVPEVEHRESKSTGGDELNWNNLLLSCKYCNTRKGTHVKQGDKENYLWPDEDDTFAAFSYKEILPAINKNYLRDAGCVNFIKAKNLFKLIKLDNQPTKPNDKDRRFFARNEARNYAIESINGWKKIAATTDKESYLATIISLAKSSGFFSTWMEIFKEEEEVKTVLIQSLPGTRVSCFENEQSVVT